MDLNNKIAIVTGGGRGIGRAIALKLAEVGANVVVNDVGKVESAESVAEEVKAMGRQSIAILADVSSTEDVTKMVETTMSTYGMIDILVNNAGITRDHLLLRMTDDDWNDVLKINLNSVFICTRAVLRHMMKQRWGRIVSIASIVGIVGNPGQANYAATKAGIIGFTRTVAKEVASRGITANAIAPGWVKTELNEVLWGDPDTYKQLTATIPMGRWAEVSEIAGVALFLASDVSSYVTGHTIIVDGGLLA